ncbi:MAG: DUF4115 domain-containing protein [Acidobacteria bacterium]|nr:DUF4115 domain-containing protein [Acidobacteriota bacterium]
MLYYTIDLNRFEFMASLGEKLKRERERLGIALPDLAERTKIASRYLEAIENNDLSCLPGEFFHRAFVKQYGAAVGMSPQQVEAELRNETPTFGVAGEDSVTAKLLDDMRAGLGVQERTSFSRGISKRWIAVAAAMVVVSVSYLGWQRTRTNEPVPRAAPVPAPAPAAAAEKPAPSPVEQPPATAEVPVQPASTAPTGEAAAPPVSEGGWTVAVTAREAVWVEFRADGKFAFAGTLNPGQSRELRARAGAQLLVGNAGGVDVTHNGKAVGPIGPAGQVRVVVFTGETAEIRQPLPKKPAAPPQT